MAERVVDLLEAINVDEQHGQGGLVALRSVQRLLGIGQQQAAVGQFGQAVVKRQLADVSPGFSRSMANAQSGTMTSTRR